MNDIADHSMRTEALHQLPLSYLYLQYSSDIKGHQMAQSPLLTESDH